MKNINLNQLRLVIRETMASEAEEQAPAGPDASALHSAGGGEQKTDVSVVLQKIAKIDKPDEYAQVLGALIDHGKTAVKGGPDVLKKLYRNLSAMMKESKLNEDDVQMEPGGNWGQPLPGESQHELVPGSVEDVANQMLDLMAEANLSHNDAVDVLNHIAIEMGLNEPEEEKRPIGFRENLRQALIKENFKRALKNAIKK